MGGVFGGTYLEDENGRFFHQPKKVDPELRENLGIFEDEDEVRSPAVISFDDPNSYSKYQFDVFRSYEDLSKEKNYEKFPTHVLHSVFLFLKPRDLISLFSTCRYFYKAGLENVFWKKFYIHFFDLSLSDSDNMADLNYKKQFFKRFSDCRCANLYYLKNHQPIFTSDSFEDDQRNEILEARNEEEVDLEEMIKKFGEASKVRETYKFCEKYSYTICGIPGTGKRSLLARLLKKKFGTEEDDELNKRIGESKLYFNVIKRKYRHRKKEKDQDDEGPLQYPFSYQDEFKRIRVLSCPSKDLIPTKKKDEDKNVDPMKTRVDLIKRNTSSFLFCFTAGDRESFDEVKKFVKVFSDTMKKSVPKKQRKRGILVGLKSDLILEGKQKKKKRVTKKEILKYIKSTNLKGYVECSAKEDTSCYLPFGILVDKHSWRISRAAG